MQVLFTTPSILQDFCIAWGKKCNKCQGLNHFAGSVVCRNKSVRELNVEKNTEEEVQHMGALFLGSIEEECSEESHEGKKDCHLDQMQSSIDSVESKQLHNVVQGYEVEVLARNGPTKFKIDTGADVSVIGVGHLEKFGLRLRNLRRTKKSLVGPDANKLERLRYFKANFKTKDQISNQICYVCKNIKILLLGRPAVKELGIVKINVPSQVTCASVTLE